MVSCDYAISTVRNFQRDLRGDTGNWDIHSFHQKERDASPEQGLSAFTVWNIFLNLLSQQLVWNMTKIPMCRSWLSRLTHGLHSFLLYNLMFILFLFYISAFVCLFVFLFSLLSFIRIIDILLYFLALICLFLNTL